MIVVVIGTGVRVFVRMSGSVLMRVWVLVLVGMLMVWFVMAVLVRVMCSVLVGVFVLMFFHAYSFAKKVRASSA